VKKKSSSANKSWRLWLLMGFVLMSVAGIYTLSGYLMSPEVLPIRSIQIKNEFRNIDKASLQQSLLKAIDGGFFSVDLHKLRDAALSLAWVAEARVTRDWPDKLIVEVVEQKPIARWGKNALLNSEGQVFHPEKEFTKTLPLRFFGDEDKSELMLNFFVTEQKKFRELGLSIAELSLDRRGEWRITLTSGLEVVVGKEKMKQRLQRWMGVYQVLNQMDKNPERVDLRYEQGFAVNWQSGEKS
jgi:cell division protein FtsQ